jgi:energy-coupling factor transport system ATP-binding protein
MDQPLISLKGVTYSYPHTPAGGPAALDGIDLEIEAGEFVGLVGANGSGKSTLAKMLNALLIPAGGQVVVAGMSTGEKRNHDRIREVAGMVFQNPDSQFVATSVADDIAFGLENLGMPPAEIDARVAETAERFGVSELLDSEPHWLSGGQKQRTALAGVMALRPEIVIFDEPTSMLDPLAQQEFHTMVAELWRSGATIIYITHVMDEISQAGRVIALEGGRIAFDGPPRMFFQQGDLLERTGLEAPLAVRLSSKLAAVGFPVELSLTLDELVQQVCI